MAQTMQPTTSILEKLRRNSEKNHDEVFTRLFRYMLRPDIYYVAYKNLYANNGAGTKGVNEDTADGFCVDYVNSITENIRKGAYQPHPVRRTYLKKANGKMRPRGIPTFTDKLVQEVLRMILESVYEPIFLDCSHGFRPGRSCHTALDKIKRGFPGARWFIEGDIKGCFDNIDHNMLMALIGKKVKDTQVRQLIYKFLKAGYLEDWQYHNTHSGTPQGGILSPLLANIYLHELDKFVEKLKEQFDNPMPKLVTPEYQQIQNEMARYQRRIKTSEGEERQNWLAQYQAARKCLVKTPAKWNVDKMIKYVRYADDFLIGVNGSQEECVEIKHQLSRFIQEFLKMELSEEKTLITHSSQAARFLGYEVRVRRDSQVKRAGTLKRPKRTLNNMVELSIPLSEKIERFLFDHGVGSQRADGKLEPCRRPGLLNRTDLEIVTIYNAELRGICNFYGMACNFNKLIYFGYLMEYSCLKTLAAKHRSKISKVLALYKDGKGEWGIPYQTKKGMKRMYFAKYKDCKGKADSDTIVKAAHQYAHSTTSFESRLKARVCEVCGLTDAERYEIHHVNKVKNLKGKAAWELIMIAKRRKTIVVCHACHMMIHHGSRKLPRSGVSMESRVH